MIVDDNFDLSNADSRLEAWCNLPTEAKTKAMNNYFCGLIMNDKFVELVKHISLSWESTILEGRVNRVTMREAANEEGEV
jgi:hypothetical protein